MTYFGSKNGAGVKERIISLQPEHDTYIELFLGSGAVMNNKPPAARQIGIEANGYTIAKYIYARGCEVINGCAFEFLDSFDFRGAGRVLIYADPPYVGDTRRGGGEYGEYELTDAQHIALLERLYELSGQGVMIMLSGYNGALYEAHCGFERRIDYKAMTHAGPVTESLWLSFSGLRPHWYKYAGDNNTQRQMIKRKAARWAKNYHALTDYEKMAVLSAMLRSG